MIAYATIRPVLLALIKQLAGVNDVTWRDQPQGVMGKPVAGYGTTVGTSIKLSIGPAQVKGRDEVRTRYEGASPAGQELRDTAVGVRHVTLKILVECLEQTDGRTADHFCEQIRGRFRWQGTIAALNAVKCGFIEAAAVQDLSTKRDNRIVSIAALDIRLSTRAVDEDPTGYPYIATAETHGEVEGGVNGTIIIDEPT